jgi:hypothetical protein
MIQTEKKSNMRKKHSELKKGNPFFSEVKVNKGKKKK